MDNGFVTGSNGKTADARNAIIIMTSNLGAADAEKRKIGFGDPDKTGEIDNAVTKFFAPEFRNRLDGIITFKKLEHSVMSKVVDKFIKELNSLMTDKNVFVQLTIEAKNFLIKHGFNDKMGARPLLRTIDEHVKKPLSREILFGRLINGGLVKIDFLNDKLEFEFLDPLPIEKEVQTSDENIVED
jgi:ATP-dependent Clp protease ATP-binding subunit ClpA